MKYKRYLIYLILLLIVLSYVGFNKLNNKNEYKNKTEAVNTTAADTVDKQKPTEQTQGSSSSSSGTDIPSEKSKTVKTDITLIDTIPNTVGNTSGNIANGGFAAQQGKWMYYTYPDSKNNRPMYRAMLDGETGFKKLIHSYEIKYINVIGEWIYYYNDTEGVIRKIKTDGTGDMAITYDRITSMVVVRDWVYYSIDSLGIFKIKIDGTAKIQLAKDKIVLPLSVDNNSIYFSCNPHFVKDSDVGLYKVDIDGSNRSKLTSDDCRNIIADGDWIYYINMSDNSTLYKIKKDGTQKKKLIDLPLSCFNISDNIIYYSIYNDPNNLYKLNSLDNKLSKLTNNTFSDLLSSQMPTDPFSIMSINIIGEDIFCSCNYQSDNFLYRVRKDGTLDKILN